MFVEVRNVWYSYPKGVTALRGVDLEIDLGEFIAIIGKNGSGKTTLAKLIAGLLKPTKGSIMVNGTDISKLSAPEKAKNIGYVFQNPDHQLFTETVYDEVIFGLKSIGIPDDKLEEMTSDTLQKLGLEKYRTWHPRDLSRGLKRKLTIAAVIAMQPKLIILDEPTCGQDRQESVEIMELSAKLVSEGKTVIMITHGMNLVADFAKRVIVVNDGKVSLDSSVKEVFSRSDILSEAGVVPPQVTQLAQSLQKFGVPSNILTVDEFIDFITKKVP